MPEPVALNPLTGAYETKTQYESTLRRAGVESSHDQAEQEMLLCAWLESRPSVYERTLAGRSERKHRLGALNPAQEGRIRRHLDALDRAHDQGDVASARSHTASLRSYLDGLGAPDVDDEDDNEDDQRDEESKTPRRSRGNKPVVDHPEGDSSSTYEQNTRARIRKLNAEFARWTA